MADTVFDYGDQALLLQFDSTADVLAWSAALRDAAIAGVLDIVPAARTVLLKLDGPAGQGAVRRRVRTLRVTTDAVATAPTEPALIDVVYDGADLAKVAEAHRPDHGAGRRRRTPAARGESDSAVSHRVSHTWSAVIRAWRYHGDPSRGHRYRPVQSAWPANSPASTRVAPPADGS